MCDERSVTCCFIFYFLDEEKELFLANCSSLHVPSAMAPRIAAAVAQALRITSLLRCSSSERIKDFNQRRRKKKEGRKERACFGAIKLLVGTLDGGVCVATSCGVPWCSGGGDGVAYGRGCPLQLLKLLLLMMMMLLLMMLMMLGLVQQGVAPPSSDVHSFARAFTPAAAPRDPLMSSPGSRRLLGVVRLFDLCCVRHILKAKLCAIRRIKRREGAKKTHTHTERDRERESKKEKAKEYKKI